MLGHAKFQHLADSLFDFFFLEKDIKLLPKCFLTVSYFVVSLIYN